MLKNKVIEWITIIILYSIILTNNNNTIEHKLLLETGKLWSLAVYTYIYSLYMSSKV